MDSGRLTRRGWLLGVFGVFGVLGALGVLAAGGCKSDSHDVPLVTPPAASPVEPPIPAALQAAPMHELSFVPLDSEAVLRVDLVKLTAGDDKSAQALDFVLRAQQTAAWEVLRSAGIRAGRELRAIYLVVGPPIREPKASGLVEGDVFLIGGVGAFDRARLIESLIRSGATEPKASGSIVEPAPGGAVMFVWDSGGEKQIGAALPPGDQPFGRVALGVAEELLLLGPPELVQRALTARAGGGKDVRRSALATELLAVNPDATAWGVAAVPSTHSPSAPSAASYLRKVWPGLVRGRFSTTIAHGTGAREPEASGLTNGAVELRVEFASAEEAEQFSAEVRRTLNQINVLADNSPVGATLTRLRELGLQVDGKVVTARH